MSEFIKFAQATRKLRIEKRSRDPGLYYYQEELKRTFNK
jgi:hypothetical protein